MTDELEEALGVPSKYHTPKSKREMPTKVTVEEYHKVQAQEELKALKAQAQHYIAGERRLQKENNRLKQELEENTTPEELTLYVFALETALVGAKDVQTLQFIRKQVGIPNARSFTQPKPKAEEE